MNSTASMPLAMPARADDGNVGNVVSQGEEHLADAGEPGPPALLGAPARVPAEPALGRDERLPRLTVDNQGVADRVAAHHKLDVVLVEHLGGLHEVRHVKVGGEGA